MIKFFRNIRHSMIKDNRISKYLLYAIGEIILVVIGILIALQINNWNEHRKQVVTQKALLTKFLQDLDVDQSNFQENLYVIALIDSLHLMFFEKAIDHENFEIKNPVLIRRAIFFTTPAMDNNPDITSNIDEETIRSEIQTYFKSISQATIVIQEHNTAILEIRDYLRKQGVHEIEQWVKNKDIENFISADRLGQLTKDPFFQQLIFESSLKLQRSKTYIDLLLDNNQKLTSLISNYLNDQ